MATLAVLSAALLVLGGLPSSQPQAGADVVPDIPKLVQYFVRCIVSPPCGPGLPDALDLVRDLLHEVPPHAS